MPQRLPIRHLRTFARLHIASLADTEDLVALERQAAPATTSRLDWTRLILSRAVTITTAREGECLVGASVVAHRPHGAIAKLLWLGVCPSGRGRGVGLLLLGTVVSDARDNGAAVVVTETSAAEADALPQLLRSEGFARRDGDDEVRYERSLWQGAEANASPGLRQHAFSDHTRPAACALLAAMATLDPGMLLTPLMEEVVGREFEAELAKDQYRPSVAVASVAAAHRVDARICRRPKLSLAGLDARPPVTPEELISCLAVGQLPLVAIRILRLDCREQRRWLLVTGFDGDLFRLADPRLPSDVIEVATRSEMRVAIAAAGFEAVILGRPAEGEPNSSSR